MMILQTCIPIWRYKHVDGALNSPGNNKHITGRGKENLKVSSERTYLENGTSCP